MKKEKTRDDCFRGVCITRVFCDVPNYCLFIIFSVEEVSRMQPSTRCSPVPQLPAQARSTWQFFSLEAVSTDGEK